jgi:ribonuclease PH
MTPDIADNADLRTCIDGVYSALVDALEYRRDLPRDIRSLLISAISVLAVIIAVLDRNPHAKKGDEK